MPWREIKDRRSNKEISNGEVRKAVAVEGDFLEGEQLSKVNAEAQNWLKEFDERSFNFEE